MSFFHKILLFYVLISSLYSFDSKKYETYLKYKDYYQKEKKNVNFINEIRFRGCNGYKSICVFERRTSKDNSVMDFIVFDIVNKTRLFYKRTLDLKDRNRFLKYLSVKYKYSEIPYKGRGVYKDENQFSFVEDEQLVRIIFKIEKAKKNTIINVLEKHELGQTYQLLKYPINKNNLIDDLRIDRFFHFRQSGAIAFIIRYNNIKKNAYEDEVVMIERNNNDLENQKISEVNNFLLTSDQKKIVYLKDISFYRGTLNVESRRNYYIDGEIK